MLKGNVFIARREYIKANCSLEQSQYIFDNISKEAQLILSKEILAIKWYEEKIEIEINQAIMRVMGNNDIHFLEQVGAFGADFNMKGIYKVLFKVVTPPMLVKKIPSLYKQLHSKGKLIVGMLSEKRVG